MIEDMTVRNLSLATGKDCLLRFKHKGRTLAVASIFRDVENLQAEVAMEREAAG